MPRPRTGVATAHPIATAVGRKVLEEGGNAYDAALAVSATLPVVIPQANGLGADLFAVVVDGAVETLNASGPAAELATPERFESAGLSAIPDQGPLSAITVPGMVASWPLFEERGTRRMADLLAPAVRWAREGVPVTPQLAGSIRRMPSSDPDWKAIYPGHAEGTTLRQPQMAHTLETVGRDGGHSFYHGEIARTIERDLVAKGGLLRFDDLDRYTFSRPPPLHLRYRGRDVYTTPPNSQGATALYWLNLLARRDLASLPPADYVAALVETMYPAYEFRATAIGDPTRHLLPSGWLDHGNGSEPGPPGSAHVGGRDTTAFSVYDGEIGLSVIQSNYEGFGSGVTVAGTGINLNDRGAYFTLDRRHHNVVAPGKKTFHTLMASAVTGRDLVLLGSMGGDVQPQVHVQVLTRLLDRMELLPSAISAPRFAYPATIYRPGRLSAEAGVPLMPLPPLPASPGEAGHCQGIQVGTSIEIGIDPRGEGLLELDTLRPPRSQGTE